MVLCLLGLVWRWREVTPPRHHPSCLGFIFYFLSSCRRKIVGMVMKGRGVEINGICYEGTYYYCTIQCIGYICYSDCQCHTCDPGYYCPEKSDVEKPCPGGSYTPSYGYSYCMICPAGKYSKSASTKCSACPAGSYSSEGAAKCLTCPVGTYSSTSGSSECLSCPPGLFDPNSSGQTSCLTAHPTLRPTVKPSYVLTRKPTMKPSLRPTWKPTVLPTKSPSAKPSYYPTHFPSYYPSSRPTVLPSSHPTVIPTANPSIRPTVRPTARPTSLPSHTDIDVHGLSSSMIACIVVGTLVVLLFIALLLWRYRVKLMNTNIGYAAHIDDSDDHMNDNIISKRLSTFEIQDNSTDNATINPLQESKSIIY